jgi:transporter family protein
MNSNYIGMIIGGVIPAIIFGLGGIFVKASNQQGISFNYFTLFSGLGVIIISLISFILFESKLVNFKSGLNAFLVGATWALGVLLVAMALVKYDTPMSIISPLNCTACLFTVFLALLIFSEWKEIHIIKLFIGTALIIAGAMLVSTSSMDSKDQESNSVRQQLHSEYIADNK